MRQIGIATTREALRWHLIEREERRFDWSSALPIVHAARDARVEVIWDIRHWELRRAGAREPVVVAEPLINVVPETGDPGPRALRPWPQ